LCLASDGIIPVFGDDYLDAQAGAEVAVTLHHSFDADGRIDGSILVVVNATTARAAIVKERNCQHSEPVMLRASTKADALFEDGKL
jgi:hypothetical protein